MVSRINKCHILQLVRIDLFSLLCIFCLQKVCNHALAIAATFRHIEVCRLLLESGFVENADGMVGNCISWQWLSSHGFLYALDPTFRILFYFYFSWHWFNLCQYPAVSLRLAAKYGSVAICALLLDYGADPENTRWVRLLIFYSYEVVHLQSYWRKYYYPIASNKVRHSYYHLV
jgi:hypothetical protein